LVFQEAFPIGKHVIKIINRGSGKVAIDALIVK
jgi:hypothetical protein